MTTSEGKPARPKTRPKWEAALRAASEMLAAIPEDEREEVARCVRQLLQVVEDYREAGEVALALAYLERRVERERRR